MPEEPQAVSERPEHPGGITVAAVTRACWILVLVLTATFHFIRGAPVDAWIFLAAGVVLALDALGWLRIPLESPTVRENSSRGLLIGTLIVALTLVLALSPLYGGVDTVLIVGGGVLLVPIIWVGPRGRERAIPPRRAIRRAAIAWSTVIVIGCAWEIVAFFLGHGAPAATTPFPALSDLLDPLIAWPPSRALLIALWLLGGYVLLRRGRQP
ncbi:hypothetical protein [Leifsonia poae]|uniref:hypothetical protein n=1 Tax=Leifsonia poae TaxID=110933 RepID=UPI001CBEA8F8|nr:hypothetical protein [Leifsonia poae]